MLVWQQSDEKEGRRSPELVGRLAGDGRGRNLEGISVKIKLAFYGRVWGVFYRCWPHLPARGDRAINAVGSPEMEGRWIPKSLVRSHERLGSHQLL